MPPAFLPLPTVAPAVTDDVPVVMCNSEPLSGGGGVVVGVMMVMGVDLNRHAHARTHARCTRVIHPAPTQLEKICV